MATKKTKAEKKTKAAKKQATSASRASSKVSGKKAGERAPGAKPREKAAGEPGKKAAGKPGSEATGKAGKKAAAKPAVERAKSAPAKPPKKVKGGARAQTKEPPDGLGDALLRALTVAMIADGEIAASERNALARFATLPLFRGVDVVRVVEHTIHRCLDEGPEPVLADVASKLRSKEDRETAFSSCLAIVATDGRVTASEARLLRMLAESLRIPRPRAKALAGPLAGALD